MDEFALERIDPNPWQPRLSEDGDHIANLATSIAEDGMMQVPTARIVGDVYGNDYRVQLAFGHSRLAAYRLLAELQGKLELGQPFDFQEDSALERAVVAADRALENGVTYEMMPLHIQDINDEQMYRFAVSENIQRRDLNAIETALAMARYRKDFGGSSREIGKLFGVNEATVRGTLRLLDLPPGAQAELRAGRISQGTARALLTMRKLTLTDEPVEEAARHLGEAGGNEAAEKYLRTAALNLNNTVGLTSRYDASDSRPIAGYLGWYLDMEEFPNWELDELGISEFVGWLGDFADVAVQKAATKAGQGAGKPVVELEYALRDVGRADLVDRVLYLVEPSACTACPYYARLDGHHICGMSLCYLRKFRAWRLHQAKDASQKLGIAIYDPGDGDFLEMSSFHASHKAAFIERDPDLRLALPGHLAERSHQWGFDDLKSEYAILVAVGRLRQALIAEKKELRKQKNLGFSGVDSRRQFLRDQKDRLRWACAKELGNQLFAGLSDPVLQALARSMAYVPNHVKKGCESMQQLRRQKLGDDIIVSLAPVAIYDAKSCADLYGFISPIAAQVGVDLPNSLDVYARELDFAVELQYPEENVSAETDDDDEEYDE